MIVRIANLRRDQRGFTLIELLVAMTIGMVVLVAAMTLLDTGARSADRTFDRADVTQRGRVAMNVMTRSLRSQVCKDTQTPPVVAGTSTSVTFYTDTDADDGFAPQAVKYWIDTTYKGGRGAIMQAVYPGGNLSATPTQRVLLEDVGLVPDPGKTPPTKPFLSYYSFNGAFITAPLDSQTTGTIPANSVAKVLSALVQFRVYPSRKSSDSGPIAGRQLDELRDGDFSNRVYVRNSDYTDQIAASNERVWAARCG